MAATVALVPVIDDAFASLESHLVITMVGMGDIIATFVRSKIAFRLRTGDKKMMKASNCFFVENVLSSRR